MQRMDGNPSILWFYTQNFSSVKSELEGPVLLGHIYLHFIKLKIIPNWITYLKSRFSFICEPH